MTSLTQSYYSGASSTQIIYQTIGNYLGQIAARYPDNEALVVRHQNIRWTYRELLEQVDRLATGMLALGIRPGDRVGIWGPNSAEWALVPPIHLYLTLLLLFHYVLFLLSIFLNVKDGRVKYEEGMKGKEGRKEVIKGGR